MQSKLFQYFYVCFLFATVNFVGCCTSAKLAEDSKPKMQVLGQTQATEWDTPSEVGPKNVKAKRNLLTPILTFLKRDTEEDYILVGKPVSFVSSEPGSKWDALEDEIDEKDDAPLRTIAQSSPIMQVGYSSPVSTNSTASAVPIAPADSQKKIVTYPKDSQEIVNLVTVLNAHQSVDTARAETLLGELRNIDRSQIQPEFYQYAIDRIRSELIPVTTEPAEETAVAPKPASLPQASPAASLKKKTPNINRERLTKSVPRIEITEEDIGEERPTAPVPGTFVENHKEIHAKETAPITQQSNVPVGHFNEPIGDDVQTPQINPVGYSSRETFQQFTNNDSPWVVPAAPKYGSEYAAAPQSWEQAASFAIQSLKHKILQAPNQDAAMTDRLRLQILEAAFYGENAPAESSQYYFPGYDETVQSFVHNELFAIATLLDEKQLPEFAARFQAAQPHFEEAQRQLAKSYPLKIRSMQFIQNSDPSNPQPGDFHGFGVYTPVKAEFKTNDWAWVYMEMENFITAGNEAVGFNTKFSISYEILDASGACVRKESFPLAEETTKSPRRDMALTVPLDLQSVLPGHYKAIIRVTDQNHLRLQKDTQRIDFIVRTVSEMRK